MIFFKKIIKNILNKNIIKCTLRVCLIIILKNTFRIFNCKNIQKKLMLKILEIHPKITIKHTLNQ